MKKDKKWWKKGKSEMSASKDIKSGDIKKEPMDETEIMKKSFDLYDENEKARKERVGQEGRRRIQELKPNILSIMEGLGFSVEDYKISEKTNDLKEMDLPESGDDSAKIYITTERMKFLFLEEKFYDMYDRFTHAIYYLGLIGLKCKICDIWEKLSYEQNYMSFFGDCIKSEDDLGGVLYTHSWLRCHKCHELLLKNIVDVTVLDETKEKEGDM